MLKQLALFNKIKEKGLKVNEYYILVKLYHKPELIGKQLSFINQTEVIHKYININGTLNETGIKLIENMDLLFKPIKKITSIQSLGPDGDAHIETFLNLFPTHVLPNGKYARGNKKNVQEHFVWFFQEYNYDWNTILQATKIYVEEYHRKNYQYMRTAMYFIKKVIDGTTISELANYCDIALSNTDYAPERFIKTKVV
jgi:hypothetical protein